jgi:hypothetical protein
MMQGNHSSFVATAQTLGSIHVVPDEIAHRTHAPASLGAKLCFAARQRPASLSCSDCHTFNVAHHSSRKLDPPAARATRKRFPSSALRDSQGLVMIKRKQSSTLPAFPAQRGKAAMEFLLPCVALAEATKMPAALCPERHGKAYSKISLCISM